MRALPSTKWRRFVEFYLLATPGYGAQTEALRRAGFAGKSTPINQARLASRLARDPRMQAAINEEAKRVVRLGGMDAAKALLALIHDPTHKDHVRAIGMIMARSDPEVSIHDVKVSHTIVDPDEEALEELRAARRLGASRQILLGLFGPNGLDRLEAMEARRADKAKVIDGEVINDAR
jgi:phage terminase small subunit